MINFNIYLDEFENEQIMITGTYFKVVRESIVICDSFWN